MTPVTRKARLIAFYLPQFHPVPENDAWWGKGFTEWTNVTKARPLFPGHEQPFLPGELGFYDLRVAETRAEQAALAAQYGIEAFCYFHYWFGDGRELLERPFAEVLASKEPDFPFCLCWANQTWTGVWFGECDNTLIEQTYPGLADHERHFDSLLPALLDPRYLKVDGCPVFIVYQPYEIPDLNDMLALWQQKAKAAGLPGIHFVLHQFDLMPSHHDATLFAGYVSPRLRGKDSPAHWKGAGAWLRRQFNHRLGRPTILEYDDAFGWCDDDPLPDTPLQNYPCVMPGWDNTPRSGRRGFVITGATPGKFRRRLQRAVDRVMTRPWQQRIVFVKSWNEWAEGNVLEPDRKNGRAYLEVVDEVTRA